MCTHTLIQLKFYLHSHTHTLAYIHMQIKPQTLSILSHTHIYTLTHASYAHILFWENIFALILIYIYLHYTYILADKLNLWSYLSHIVITEPKKKKKGEEKSKEFGFFKDLATFCRVQVLSLRWCIIHRVNSSCNTYLETLRFLYTAVIKQWIQGGKQTVFLAIKASFEMNSILTTRREADWF